MSPERPPTIAVVGAGISGLVAARTLLESTNALVVLIEASDHLGGKLRTEVEDDIRYEAGPDSFLARDDTAVELCRELGLADELVAPAVFGAEVWRGGRLKRLPQGSVYGIPTSVRSALASGSISVPAAIRLGLDHILPGRLKDDDIAVGDLIKRRLGRGVLTTSVDPVLAGTRAGTPDTMSLAAAMPQVYAAARSHRSLLGGLRAAQRAGSLESGAPPFVGLRGGMQTLADALADDVRNRASVRTGATADRIEAHEHLALDLDRGERMLVDAIILAVPAPVAAHLLQPVAATAAATLGRVRFADVAVVTLVYPPGSVTPRRGTSGVLVPSSEDSTIAACTWSWLKWPQWAPLDDRAVVRAVVGRADRHPALDLDDDALADAVARDLAAMPVVTGEPTTIRVQRWDMALPQFEVGHLERLNEVTSDLDPLRIALAGAGYTGSGIPDCIRSGRDAAHRVLAPVTTDGG